MHRKSNSNPDLPSDACAPIEPQATVAQPADVFAYLEQRYSVGPKFLAPPAPSDSQWAQAAAVALRAPDHGGLRPFRFVVVGDEHRALLASLFAQAAARRGLPDEEVEAARERAFNGPGLVALVGRIRDGDADVPVHEQWVCIGAGLMNFLNGLHLMGFGAKALSGSSVRDPAIRSALCADDETLVAWIIAGTPTRSAHPKRADDLAGAIGRWEPD
jgi:nitroreductase